MEFSSYPHIGQISTHISDITDLTYRTDHIAHIEVSEPIHQGGQSPYIRNTKSNIWDIPYPTQIRSHISDISDSIHRTDQSPHNIGTIMYLISYRADPTHRVDHILYIGEIRTHTSDRSDPAHGTCQIPHARQIRSHTPDRSYPAYRTQHITHIGWIRSHTPGKLDPIHQTDQISRIG